MQPDSPPVARSRLAPLLEPLWAFLAAESAGGVVLLVSAVAAMVWANSPWAESYRDFWHIELSLRFGQFAHVMTLHDWVDDGLMAVFFLLVGLEIKRELVIGELASVRRASLPVAAAIGGMVVPALLFAAVNARGAGVHGWGIPMATDIAFAVGVLALVGRGLPSSIKVFLLAVAIVDDLGAVLVIAVFYTSKISLVALAVAGAFLVGLILLNLLRVHRTLPYMFLGLGLWAATLYSGIHATIAGVLLALTIPATRQVGEQPYVDCMKQMLAEFEREMKVMPGRITEAQSHVLSAMEFASRAVQTPLARVEHALLRPVNFLIMPLFALANAGIVLGAVGLKHPVAWGVILGLIVGKPTGILLASWAAVKGGAAELPSGATWRQMLGISVLCGLGFTMSLFIANLAFPGDGELLAAGKAGILTASLISGVIGGAIIAAGRSRA